MSDEQQIETVARMAAVLCGRGGGQGAKARRKAARRAWALYAEVHKMRLDGMDMVNEGSAVEGRDAELVGADA